MSPDPIMENHLRELTGLRARLEPGHVAIERIDARIAEARAALAMEAMGAVIDDHFTFDAARRWMDGSLAPYDGDRERALDEDDRETRG